jgi:pantoate--beta-alanine ligase
MKIVHNPDEMKNLCLTYRKAGKTIGLVPTMGALHAGHLSLLTAIQKQCDISVMSIFVNPAQFGPNEDFAHYPRPFEADCALAKEHGCDILFAPKSEAMYPPHYATYVNVECITGKLCGMSRPGHFKGVTTVVLKFFNIVMPHSAIFGQKDAQQVIVLKRMVSDLNCPVTIIVAPIVREPDGLAMSSRNRYLTPEERTAATALHKGIAAAEKLYAEGERTAETLIAAVNVRLAKTDILIPEYIELADMVSLEAQPKLTGATLLAVAVRTSVTRTRLIDNTVLGGCL